MTRLDGAIPPPRVTHHIMILSTSCIQLHRMLGRPCHAAYSNRAACHTHLGTFSAALEDADRCIALDPAWGRGYWRKGHVGLLTEQYAMASPSVYGSTFSHDRLACHHVSCIQSTWPHTEVKGRIPGSTIRRA